MDILNDMFPFLEEQILRKILKDNDGKMDATIDHLLIISENILTHKKEETKGKIETDTASTSIEGNKNSNELPAIPESLRRFGSITNSPSEDCAICLDPFEGENIDRQITRKIAYIKTKFSDRNESIEALPFRLSKCKHTFHVECTRNILVNQNCDEFLECPLCKSISGTKVGLQPISGNMLVKKSDNRLPGFENNSCGMIIVTYNFTSGIQDSKHPNPGLPYSARSFPRTAYFPDNEQGQRVVDMIRIAFERRLVFTVGRSLTTGEDNVITWNEIHHKTQICSTSHGYPDPQYLDNIERELKAVGITVADLPYMNIKTLSSNIRKE